MALFPADGYDAGFTLREYVVALALAFLVYVTCKATAALYIYRRRVRQISKLPGLRGHVLFGALEEVSLP